MATTFEQNYIDLLIKQYWEQPNAVAEIEAQAATWEKIRDVFLAFDAEFDLDTAVGAQLDIIGKTVGLLRADHIEFNDDEEYRFFLRLQISRNNGSAFMVSDDKTSIQDVIQFAFEKLAYVIDSKNMTLTLYIEDTFDITRLLLILELAVLPKPQGVRYIVIMYETFGLPFGFSELTEPLPTDVAGYTETGVSTLPTAAQVGSSLAVSTVDFPALAALNSTDVVFIDVNTDELRTYRFNGSTWSLVGSGLSISSVGIPALTALNGTDVAFIDISNDELRTYRFNGSVWSLVGSGLSIVTDLAVAIAALNETDVAFIDDHNDELRTYRWDGSTWSLVGTGLSISTVGVPALAALDGTDVAFIDGTNDELRIYRFTPDIIGGVYSELFEA